MSGGHFDYKQYHVEEIARDMEGLQHDKTDPNDYSPEVYKEFDRIKNDLYRLAKEVKHVDWLLSGDDGEETFIENIKEGKEDTICKECENMNNSNSSCKLFSKKRKSYVTGKDESLFVYCVEINLIGNCKGFERKESE